jgi:isopenicillin N synthase-like dioxygenase
MKTGDRCELERLGNELRTASEQVGFYQLVGHGVPASELAAILEWAKKFHALPQHVKEEILMDRPSHLLGGVGYLGYGNRKLPTRDTGNRNAAFLLKRDNTIGFSDNQWPPNEALPGFRNGVV